MPGENAPTSAAGAGAPLKNTFMLSAPYPETIGIVVVDILVGGMVVVLLFADVFLGTYISSGTVELYVALEVCITEVILATYRPFRTPLPRDIRKDAMSLNDSEFAGAGSGTNTAVVLAGLSFTYIKDMFEAYGIKGIQGSDLFEIRYVLHSLTVMLSAKDSPGEAYSVVFERLMFNSVLK